LADVVAMSLSKRPETRYQDGEEFATDLRTVMAELGMPQAVTSAPASYHDEKTQIFSRQEASMPADSDEFAATQKFPAASPATPGFDKTQINPKPPGRDHH
jgi:eukaryotic-like serine/threonine-protein kinase